MMPLDLAAARAALMAELPEVPESALDLLLDGDKRPIEGSCDCPFIWGPGPDAQFNVRPAEVRIGRAAARVDLYWLMPLNIGCAVVPDRILGRIVQVIDSGKAVVVRGMSHTAVESVCDAVMPMVGGFHA